MSNRIQETQPNNINKQKRSPEANRRLGNTLKTVGALALAGTVGFGGHTVYEAAEHGIDVLKNPVEYSAETQNFMAQPGDGLWNAAEMVENVGTTVNIQDVIRHISQDPANIEALKDGLQVHEKLVIPVSATPRR